MFRQWEADNLNITLVNLVGWRGTQGVKAVKPMQNATLNSLMEFAELKKDENISSFIDPQKR